MRHRRGGGEGTGRTGRVPAVLVMLKTECARHLHVDIKADGKGFEQLAAGQGPGCFLHSRSSEEHTSELQSLLSTSYAVSCLKQKTTRKKKHVTYINKQNNSDNTP